MTPAASMVHARGLQHLYSGGRGLRDFTLEIERGELVGLVGPNGAGKTTLIKVLATLLRPGAGEAAVNGFDVASQPRTVRAAIGYMPDVPGVYQDMKVREFLQFFADAFHLPAARKAARIDYLLEWSGLAGRAGDFVEHLSLGWRQRLALARALLHEPALLLLDEPATGLDPLARVELRRRLKELHEQGTTILIASHILADLEDICTRVVFIADGANIAPGESAPAAPQSLICEFGFLADPRSESLARTLQGVKVLDFSSTSLRLKIAGSREELAAVVSSLVDGGLKLTRVQPVAGGLETRYRELFESRPSGGEA